MSGALLNTNGVDVRIDAAGEFFEHEVLVLHLGRVAAGLEQALAVPVQRLGEYAVSCSGVMLNGARRIELGLRDVRQQPLVEEGKIADCSSVSCCWWTWRLCSEWKTW